MVSSASRMIHQLSPIRRNWRPTRNSERLLSLIGHSAESDQQAVAHQPSAGKVGKVFACFTPPDPLEPKRQQPLGGDDAMIFGPRPRLVAEIGLDLPQPDKVASGCKDCSDPADLADVACACNRTDTTVGRR